MGTLRQSARLPSSCSSLGLPFYSTPSCLPPSSPRLHTLISNHSPFSQPPTTTSQHLSTTNLLLPTTSLHQYTTDLPHLTTNPNQPPSTNRQVPHTITPLHMCPMCMQNTRQPTENLPPSQVL